MSPIRTKPKKDIRKRLQAQQAVRESALLNEALRKKPQGWLEARPTRRLRDTQAEIVAKMQREQEALLGERIFPPRAGKEHKRVHRQQKRWAKQNGREDRPKRSTLPSAIGPASDAIRARARDKKDGLGIHHGC